MQSNETNKNRGTHGDSLRMLGEVSSSNKNPPALAVGSVNGEPYFVGKDVAEILGYSNASKAVLDHVDEEDKCFKMLGVSDSQNGNLVKTALIEIGVKPLPLGMGI